MDNPTHADAFLNLLSSCFPTCRSNAPALPPSPQLGALLRDTESDDAMSLHSTYRPHTRQKKKKPMQLCGVNLFGKPRGPIRLEDEDEPARPRYDSDAAPVADSTIQSLSTPTSEQPPRHETLEEELARLRAEKAARIARKRERKRKRQLLALEPSGEFEGFIGSGAFPISPPSTTTSTPGIEDLMSDRESTMGSHRSVEDPEDGDADMGAAVYTRSARARSESGSSATRSSRARDELVPGNALGLRGPPSPLVQEYIPETPEPVEPMPESMPESKPESKPESTLVESTPEFTPAESKAPRPKPKIRIDLPLSSPGAGPGPRTLENSPRLGLDTTRLASPSPLDSLTIPRPILPSGFPSSGLSRRGPVGKSVGSGPGLGLNCLSPVGGRSSEQFVGTGRNGRNGHGNGQGVFSDDNRRSGHAGSQRSSGDSDGSRSAGNGPPGEHKARLTPQMGVALANRGGE